MQTVNEACGDGKTSGCEVVARSSWSSVRGIPLAALGLLFSLVLAAACALALAVGERGPGGAREPRPRPAGRGARSGRHPRPHPGLRGEGLLRPLRRHLRPERGGVRGPVAGPGRARRGARAALSSAEARPALVGLVLSALAAGGRGDRPRPRAHGPRGRAQRDPAGRRRAPRRRPRGRRRPRPRGSDRGGARPPTGRPRRGGFKAILDDPHQLEHYFTDKAAREYAAAKVESLDLAGVPAKGPAEAPVKVVEYSDFLCPFCRNLSGALSSFLAQAGGRVQIFYKNYPLDQDLQPEPAAQRARRRLPAGPGRPLRPGPGEVLGLPRSGVRAADGEGDPGRRRPGSAGEAGLDAAAFGSCLDSQRTQDRLDGADRGSREGGRGSPPPPS